MTAVVWTRPAIAQAIVDVTGCSYEVAWSIATTSSEAVVLQPEAHRLIVGAIEDAVLAEIGEPLAPGAAERIVAGLVRE